jgi:hypothetical protein
MPNICQNTVEVRGKDEDVKTFVEYMRTNNKNGTGEDYAFDFEKILPRPPWFHLHDQIIKKWWNDRGFENVDDYHITMNKLYNEALEKAGLGHLRGCYISDLNEDQAKSLQAIKDNVEPFSKSELPPDNSFSSGGHKWDRLVWGTAENWRDSIEEQSEGYARYSFDTAWGYPNDLYMAMYTMFPHLTFEITGWSFENMDNLIIRRRPEPKDRSSIELTCYLIGPYEILYSEEYVEINKLILPQHPEWKQATEYLEMDTAVAYRKQRLILHLTGKEWYDYEPMDRQELEDYLMVNPVAGTNEQVMQSITS